MKICRLPYSYTGVRQTLQRAADAAGIGKLTTHAFRHSFRTWLNQTSAPIATQQKLVRALKSRNDYGYVRHDVRFGIDSGQQQGCGERFRAVRPVIR